MNPVDPIVDAKLKPVPVWLKGGVALVLLMAGVLYVMTRGSATPPAINIDPPGGVAGNAAVDKSADKSVDKMKSANANAPSVNGLTLLPATAMTAANTATLPANSMVTTPASNISNVVSADTAPQLNRLSEQLGQLQLLVNQLSDVSGQLNQRIAQLDERLPKVAAKQVSTPTIARRAFVKPSLTVTAPVAMNALPNDVPMLVAVDSWDGRPSVSIRTARGIVFASEGDQVEGWQLVSTNARAQRAEFYRPQNGNVTVGAQPVLASAP